MLDAQKLAQLDRQHVLHPLQDRAHYQTGPVVIVRGHGATIVDANGKEYIDGLSGLWNVAAGHGRAELGEAAAAQMRTLGFSSGYSGASNVPAIQLAERLAKLAPGDLNATYYTTGGAESNETAFKIARFYWKQAGKPDKVKIVSRQSGYHGTTGAAMSATGLSMYWKSFEPLQPGFFHVPTHYCFHCPLHMKYPECGVACADTLEHLILAEGPETVAAFIAEPVMGAGGLIPPPPEYWPKIRAICDSYDVLLIADEVITGFGRTGKWFGQMNWSATSDMISFAKAVTSAYAPLGGVIVNERIQRVFREMPEGVNFSHAYTYSLHPVCCAVGLRNLDIIEGEGLVDRAAAMGRRLRDGLNRLEGAEGVGEVRGLGLMVAVEMAADRSGTPLPASLKAGKRAQEYMMEHGLLTRMKGDIIMLAPPFVVTEAEVDRIVETVSAAVAHAVS